MSLFVALAAASAAAAATTAKSGPAPAGKEAPKKTFTVTTSPIELRYAQVHNKRMPPAPLPASIIKEFADGKSNLAISGFELEIVRTVNGEEVPVPLYDHYLHHYILHMGGMDGMLHMEYLARNRSSGLNSMMPRVLNSLHRNGAAIDVTFGSAAGAEFRHNPHEFKRPFRIVLARPTTWAPTIHMINVLSPAGGNHSVPGKVPATYLPTAGLPTDDLATYPPSPLLQCPCTPQRDLDAVAGTVDGKKPVIPFGHCSEAMRSNPSCSIETYLGGWRCCEDGVFLIDTDKCKHKDCAELPKSSVQVKVHFTYEAIDAVTAKPIGIDEPVRHIAGTECCDVTQNPHRQLGNVEYDVLQCKPGTPPSECVQIDTNVQFFDINNASDPLGATWLDMTFTSPHLHVTGISLELQDAITNQTLCMATRANGGITYGSSNQAGDEAGYLTGLRPCVWGGDDAPRFQRRHPMRTIAVYNASTQQTGVMALWLTTAAEVEDKAACAAAMQKSKCMRSPLCSACAAAAAETLYAAGCQPRTIAALCSQSGAATTSASSLL